MRLLQKVLIEDVTFEKINKEIIKITVKGISEVWHNKRQKKTKSVEHNIEPNREKTS